MCELNYNLTTHENIGGVLKAPVMNNVEAIFKTRIKMELMFMTRNNQVS